MTVISFLKTILITCDFVSSYYNYYALYILLFHLLLLLLVIIYFYLFSFITNITFTLNYIIVTTITYNNLMLSINITMYCCYFFLLVIIYYYYLFSFTTNKMLLLLCRFNFFSPIIFHVLVISYNVRLSFFLLPFAFLISSSITVKSLFHTMLAYSFPI